MFGLPLQHRLPAHVPAVLGGRGRTLQLSPALVASSVPASLSLPVGLSGGWPCRDRGDGVHPKKKERPIHRPGSAVCPRSRCVRSQLRALLTPPSRRQCSFCLTGPIQLPAALAQGCSEPFLQSGLVRELSSGTGPAPRFCKIRGTWL